MVRIGLLCLLSLSAVRPAAGAQQPPPAAGPAAAPQQPVTVGAGSHRYAWVSDWGRPEGGKELGNTHGCMLVDKQGRILANTDTEQAVMIFSPAGKLLESWGKEFRGGLHGMCLREEDGQEVLYLAHHGRHAVFKTTIAGKLLWTLGWPEQTGLYAREDEFKPTSVAVAPDGRIFVADGYGKSWVHVYTRDRAYVRSIGGPGEADGRFQSPHGILIDTRGKEPLLLVCDRENHRLQWLTLDGAFVRKLDRGLKRPSNVTMLRDGGLAIADLVGRVTILDRDDRIVCHLGDEADPKLQAVNGVGREHWRPGVFFAPHSVCEDARGDLYVMDWNSLGRFTRLVKLP